MNQQNIATTNQILYAQALQIALILSGQKPNFDGRFALDTIVTAHLQNHENLTKQVYSYLCGRRV